jgi:hypothetical protein
MFRIVVLSLAFILAAAPAIAQEFGGDTLNVRDLPGGGILTTVNDFQMPFGSYTIESERATVFAPSRHAKIVQIDFERAVLVDESGRQPPIYLGSSHLKFTSDHPEGELIADGSVIASARVHVDSASAKGVSSLSGGGLSKPHTYSFKDGIVQIDGKSTGQSSTCVGSMEMVCEGNSPRFVLVSTACTAG